MTSRLREIYKKVPYLPIKYNTYLPAYEAQRKKHAEKSIATMAVELYRDGSLFMGSASIVGVKHDARRRLKNSVKIRSGDQSSKIFQTRGLIALDIHCPHISANFAQSILRCFAFFEYKPHLNKSN